MSSNDGAGARKTGIVLSYVYLAANLIVQLVYVPLLLSNIGQEEYGLYQLVGSIMSYLVSISGILSSGVGRYYCMYKAEGDSRMMENTLAIAKRMYWVISAIAALIVVAMIPAVRLVYQGSFSEEQLNECGVMMSLLAVNLIVSLNNTINNAAITANERFFFAKVLQLVTLVSQPFIVVGMLNFYPKASVVVAVTLAMNIVSALVQRFYARSVLSIKVTYHGWDTSLVKGLVSFSGAILLVTFADQIFWKTDQLIIGYMYGAASVAVYSIGSSIYMNFMPVGSTIASVFLPRVSQLLHRYHDFTAVSDLFIKVGRISFLLCSFVLGAFVIVGHLFISIWAGPEYEDAYYIALVVMIPMLIDICQNLGLTILQVINKYHFRGYVYFSTSLVNIVLTVFMLRTCGLIGAALSTGIAMFIGNGLVMNWYYSKIGLKIRSFWLQIGKIAINSLISIGLGYIVFLSLSHYFSGILLICLAFFAYGILFLFISWRYSMNAYEKNILLSIAKKSHLTR